MVRVRERTSALGTWEVRVGVSVTGGGDAVGDGEWGVGLVR